MDERGFAHRQTDEWSDIGDCRVAFVTENLPMKCKVVGVGMNTEIIKIHAWCTECRILGQCINPPYNGPLCRHILHIKCTVWLWCLHWWSLCWIWMNRQVWTVRLGFPWGSLCYIGVAAASDGVWWIKLFQRHDFPCVECVPWMLMFVLKCSKFIINILSLIGRRIRQ